MNSVLLIRVGILHAHPRPVRSLHRPSSPIKRTKTKHREKYRNECRPHGQAHPEVSFLVQLFEPDIPKNITNQIIVGERMAMIKELPPSPGLAVRA